jgi:hypothetical protein
MNTDNAVLRNNRRPKDKNGTKLHTNDLIRYRHSSVNIKEVEKLLTKI